MLYCLVFIYTLLEKAVVSKLSILLFLLAVNGGQHTGLTKKALDALTDVFVVRNWLEIAKIKYEYNFN